MVLPAALVLVVRVPACSRRGTERQEGCYRGKTAPWIKPAALGALWMHKKSLGPSPWLGKESGVPARAPTFQLAAVVGGVPVLLVLPVVPRGRFVPRHL